MKPTRDNRRDRRSERGRPQPRSAPQAERPRSVADSVDGCAASAAEVRRPGALPAEKLPLILEVAPNADYALLDSGDGEKLEQYGPYRIVRPEGQAIWRRALPRKRMEPRRRGLHRRHRRGRHGPLALSQNAARRNLADEA